MARTDTLPHFLTDVADAIREKKGTQETIQASDFDTEIENLPSGGGADLSEYFINTIVNGSSTSNGVSKMIKKIPDDTTINPAFTSAQYMFNNCNFLVSIPTQFDTSSITNMRSMFQNCTSLTTIPLLNTQSVTSMQGMFSYCSSLTSIPQLDTQNVTNMQNMFQGCNSLSDTSLDNILQMCINATSYTGTKTLAYLGINATYHPASKIQALPHYQDFIDAGWTIGY